MAIYDINGNALSVSGNAQNFDINVKGVNHRGYNSVAPENTIPAYKLSKQNGFFYVETDISFTSDGVPVLLHDATIDRTSNGTGNIGSLTYADVRQYDFGSWKSSTYAGTKIPSFEEFLNLCKNIVLHPYIELKNNGSYTQAQIESLVDMVKSYGMLGKVTWISFSATYLGYVKAYDTLDRLGYLSSSAISSSMITTCENLKTDDNEVFLDIKYTSVNSEGVELAKSAEIPLEIWTVDAASGITGMNKYVSGVTSDSLIAGQILCNASIS